MYDVSTQRRPLAEDPADGETGHCSINLQDLLRYEQRSRVGYIAANRPGHTYTVAVGSEHYECYWCLFRLDHDQRCKYQCHCYDV